MVEHLYRTLERLETRLEGMEPAITARIDRCEVTLGARIDRVETDLAAAQRQFALIGWSMAGLVAAQLVAGIVTAVVALT